MQKLKMETQITIEIGFIALTALLVLCYIVIFTFSVNKILEAFSDNAKPRAKYYKKFGLCAIGGFLIYCGIFFISNFIYIDKLANFIKDTNDKVFGFLSAALIAQFLSFLFSRQNYNYQSKLANNKAKADRIEHIMKAIGSSIASLTIAMLNSINFQRQLGQQQNFSVYIKRFSTQNKEKYDGPDKNKIESNLQEEIQKYINQENINRTGSVNEKSSNWQVDTTSFYADFTSLDFTPLNNYIYRITKLFKKATNYMNSGNITDFNDAENALKAISPYSNTILTVLLTLANAIRAGNEVSCPSEKELDDFIKFPTELENWIESTKK